MSIENSGRVYASRFTRWAAGGLSTTLCTFQLPLCLLEGFPPNLIHLRFFAQVLENFVMNHAEIPSVFIVVPPVSNECFAAVIEGSRVAEVLGIEALLHLVPTVFEIAVHEAAVHA